MITRMKIKFKIRRVLACAGLFATLCFPAVSFGQCTGENGYTCDNCIPCGGELGPCCAIYNACNGPYSGCNTYEAGNGSDGNAAVNGCDMACTPIDSGVLFLLLGGAAFGGFMISRRRKEEHALQTIDNHRL